MSRKPLFCLVNALIPCVTVIVLALAWHAAALAEDGHTKPTILIMGDSLSAAYGIDPDQAWPALLKTRLRDQGYDYRVVNASVSGDTTQGGRYRMQRALEHFSPAIVIIELGGNDGLRGVPLETTRNNLAVMIELSQRAGAQVILAGMQIPPNYGPAYSESFRMIYPELAAEMNTALIPFFLDKVALVDSLKQGDGIHPNADAQPLLLANVWQTLQPVLSGSDVGSALPAN